MSFCQKKKKRTIQLARSPPALTSVSTRELENWRSTPDDLEEREKSPEKRPKKTSTPPYPPESVPVSVVNGKCPPTPELSLRHLHCSRDTCHCMITATSMTAELHLRHHDDLQNRDIDNRLKCCNCGTFAVFCTLNHPASVVAHNGHATTTSMQRFSQRNATVGSRPSSHRPHPRNLLDLHTRTSNTISMDCNWGISVVCWAGPRETASAKRQCYRRPKHAQQWACQ